MAFKLSAPPKFSSKCSWDVFSSTFEAFLDANDLFAPLLNDFGSIREPDDAEIDAADRALLERKLFSCLLLSCVSSSNEHEDAHPGAFQLMNNFKGTETCGTSAWKSLRDRFAPKDNNRSVTLFRKLLMLKMISGECSNEYVASHEKLYSELVKCEF
jgi:hypothetical protein